MATKQLRALVGARVSVLSGPQKVSHEAQHETCRRWVETNGHEIVGAFEDLGVSATVEPEKRPSLGRWLTEEGSLEWDVVVWSKMDRAFRSTRHCVDFVRWCETRKKIVVFAEDGLVLNYRDPGSSIESMMSELFVYIGSFFAQLELNRFQSRARDSHRVIRGTDRWASGVPPLGYRIVDHPSGRGKALEIDPVGRDVLYRMAGNLINGWSFIRITDDLNDAGIPTAMDRHLIARGKEPRQKPWNVNSVIDALTSPRTQGWKTTTTSGGKKHKPVQVLDDRGEPIRMAPPVFDDETWSQIQHHAEKRFSGPRSRTNSPNPLLGIGYCGVCGRSLAQHVSRKRGNEYRGYRCSRTPVNCRNTYVRAEELDPLLEQHFLDAYGDDQVTRLVFVPGDDTAAELEQVNETIARLRRESDEGLIRGAADEAEYLDRMRALLDRRADLESAGGKTAGWISEETGRTFREAWADEETDRRQTLIDRGVKLYLDSAKPFVWRLEVPRDTTEPPPVTG